MQHKFIRRANSTFLHFLSESFNKDVYVELEDSATDPSFRCILAGVGAEFKLTVCDLRLQRLMFDYFCHADAGAGAHAAAGQA